MHYANGREAKNGDRILRAVNTMEYQKPVVGILHDAVAGNDTCNGWMATPNQNYSVNLSECLHIDDVIAAIGDRKVVKDTSKKA